MAIEALGERVRKAKAGEEFGSDAADVLDGAAVLILDSDLTPNPGEDVSETVRRQLSGEVGAEVARLARAHTTAGAVIVVNQGAKRRTFDLTMSKLTLSQAEVYITQEDVASKLLWFGGDADGSFRPWSWPVVTGLDRLMLDALPEAELATPVLEALGLTEGLGAPLSDGQLELLNDNLADADEITFLSAARSQAFGLSMQPAEEADPNQLLRVAKWGVRRWLDRIVTAPQNILVDWPHMVQDRPWLLDDRDNIDAWNNNDALWGAPEPVEGALSQGYNAAASRLLGRRVWNVWQLPATPPGERVRASDPVFCEDTSRFLSADRVSEFASNLSGSYSSRYAEVVRGVEYSPRRRLMK